jgi:hypothetical protein
MEIRKKFQALKESFQDMIWWNPPPSWTWTPSTLTASLQALSGLRSVALFPSRSMKPYDKCLRDSWQDGFMEFGPDFVCQKVPNSERTHPQV